MDDLKCVYNVKSAPMSNGPKKRFYVSADITMLKSTLTHNPWVTGPKAWADVVNDIKAVHNMELNKRQVRERCTFLMKRFKEGAMSEINKTGTELEWAERKMLLEGVCNMADSTTNAKLHEGGDQSASHLPDSFVGHQDWDESTKTCEGNLPETLSMNSGEGWLSFNGSKSSKRPRIDLSSILAQRVAQEMEYKKIEMELRVERQKRDLDFQERQLDLEEKRLQLEEKHLEQRAQERESQQALVMSMMSFMQNCMNIIADSLNG